MIYKLQINHMANIEHLEDLPLKYKNGKNKNPENMFCPETNSVEVYYLIFRSEQKNNN